MHFRELHVGTPVDLPRHLHEGSMTQNSTPSGSRKIAWLLDKSIPLPGGYRIGLDGVLGLIPGVGDFAGGILSTWALYQAVKLGAPKSVIFRILLNIAIDSIIGTIPILGDLFDFVWKSNYRNLKLLEDFEAAPGKTRSKALISSLAIVGGGVALIIAVIYGLVSLIKLAWQ